MPMAYDIVRWICGVILFAVILTVLILFFKQKKAKAVVTSAFAAIIITAILFFIPFENYVYRFPSIEKIYEYKHHEPLLTYFQGNEGIVCIAERSDGSNINYYFQKKQDKYTIPFSVTDSTQRRSSRYGVFMIKKFDTETIIYTQVSDIEYDGEKFQNGGMGYYYYVIDGNFIASKLTYLGEKITLV